MGAEVVSIIMPAYNAERFIAKSIESVLAQTFTNWRLYIIDDASGDNTSIVVNSYNDPRITYVLKAENEGVAAARNEGIRRAQGHYISFLDSDDLWESQKLEKQLLMLEQGFDVVCSSYGVFSDDANFLLGIRCFPEVFTYSRMLRGNCIGNLTGIYNQKKLGKCFQHRCGHEDYLMWLELIQRAGKGYCVKGVLAKYRISASSLSGNKIKAAKWQWNIYRQMLGLGFLFSSYLWVNYVFHALMGRIYLK
jgi:Glycosyltransferases involved in cell wall biogenesis